MERVREERERDREEKIAFARMNVDERVFAHMLMSAF